MTVILVAFLIGIVAGLRTMTAPAAVSWAAYAGRIDVSGSWLAFLAYQYTPWIISLLAIVEMIGDQLPSTPSRTVPLQFGARLIMGGLCGAAVGMSSGSTWVATLAGLIGAVVGTYGGAATRARLAAAFGSDRPAAFLEDGIAVVGAFLILWGLGG